jgi:hypothetical protein
VPSSGKRAWSLPRPGDGRPGKQQNPRLPQTGEPAILMARQEFRLQPLGAPLLKAGHEFHRRRLEEQAAPMARRRCLLRPHMRASFCPDSYIKTPPSMPARFLRARQKIPPSVARSTRGCSSVQILPEAFKVTRFLWPNGYIDWRQNDTNPVGRHVCA